MLEIVIPGVEVFDEDSQEFLTIGTQTIQLEHSLHSLSKWESTWEKPFLATKEKTTEEVYSYVMAMAQTPGVTEKSLLRLSQENFNEIQEYIERKMTATRFNELYKDPVSSEVFTAEILYHYMIEFGIPMECQYWHLNRLITLIRVRSNKLGKPKKMSQRQVQQQYRDLNAKRRAEMGTKG